MRIPQWNPTGALALALCFLPLIPEALIEGTGALVLFAVVAVLLLVSGDVRRATLRWHEGGAWREIGIGVGLGALFAALSMGLIDPLLGALLNSKTDLSSFAAVRGNPANALALLAVAWVIGALGEEVSHRGFVIGWGSKLLGERSQIPLLLVTSAVFGAAHLYQGPVGAISAGISGLFFGSLYLWRGKTLLAPIFAHGIFDTVGITAIFLGLGLA